MNHVSNLLQNIQSAYGTPTRLNNARPNDSIENKTLETKSNHFSTSFSVPAKLFSTNVCSRISEDFESNFDPLLPSSNNKNSYENTQSSSDNNGSNLIDFN